MDALTLLLAVSGNFFNSWLSKCLPWNLFYMLLAVAVVLPFAAENANFTINVQLIYSLHVNSQITIYTTTAQLPL